MAAGDASGGHWGYPVAVTKHFNTAGPCLPDLHYMLPPEARLPEVRGLIDQRAFFVIHAPRQTGKTTFISQLGRALTAEGRYAAVHCSCEPGKAFDDVGLALEGVLGSLAFSARLLLPPELRPPPLQRGAAPSTMLLGALVDWAASCPRPIVLFLDEIDSLRGDALASILSQLRTGYEHRGAGFPWSVALCGLRDVRDYRAAGGGDPRTLGSSSPFNVKVKSLELASFGREDVERLYAQHTMATGQVFTPAALDRAWELSVGQPWLANALAREVVEEIRVPSPEPIEAEHLDAAKERLILARQTHLDSLMARLQETRVRRVLEPLLSGEGVVGDSSDDDVAYVRDLGLIAPGDPVRMANPIYREVVVRALGEGTSGMVVVDPRAFDSVPRLELRRTLRLPWRSHSSGWHSRAPRASQDWAAEPCETKFTGCRSRPGAS